MKYNEEQFTYGCEIEWGDVDKRLIIPNHIGEWDYSETDILNLREPFKNIAVDPLGENPYVGGEINTYPTKTIEGQLKLISELKEFFIENGCEPTASCVNEGHVHIHVPGLKDDIDALKKLTLYIADNSDAILKYCVKFEEHPTMKDSKGAKMYLKYDIGRIMPEYMVDNIINKATDFNSFIKMQCAGKDGISMGRPFRYAINTYCLKHTDTVEFRCFRATTDLNEIYSQLTFIREFMDAALNDGPDVETILKQASYKFPQFYWNKEQYDCWIATKYPKERGKKIRKYYEVK